jgi:hypothetical protein
MILSMVNPYRLAAAGGSFTPNPISLTDDYDDASFDTAKWNSTTVLPPWSAGAVGGTRTESGGVLNLTPATSTDTTEGCSSVNTYDFSSGKTAYVHLSNSPTNNSCSFGLWAGSGQYIRFQVDKVFGVEWINAYKSNSGTNESLWGGGGSATYSATDHAWLAIHYNGSAFEVYTAPDSGGSPGTWTLRGTSTTSLFAVTALYAGCFTQANHASPGTATFDGFCTSD